MSPLTIGSPLRDLRLAVRTLLRRPLFAITAVLALAIGIGADSAIFAVVDAILVRPLDYADPDRLVVLLHGGDHPVAPANFLDWRRDLRSFARLGAAESWSPSLTSDGPPEKVHGLHVTSDALAMLGVRPLLGRLPTAREDVAGNDHEAVLGYALWQRRFGGERSAVGRTITIDGESYVVIGIMPPSFHFAPFWATNAELWAPLALDARATSRRGQSLRVFGRLARGVSLDVARADVATVTARLEREFPGTNRDVTVTALKEKVVGDVRPTLLVLSAAAGFVLLIVCANVAHLLLARGAARRTEMTVRAALGATRGRLMRQLLGETLLLAGTGGALGLGFGAVAVRAVVALGPRDLPRLASVALDGRTVLATLVLSVIVGVACGLVPALRAAAEGTDDHAGTRLRDDSRGATAGARQHRARRVLIASEFALAVVLLVGAVLMMRTVAALHAIQPGFDARGVLTAVVSVNGSAEAEPGRRAAFYDALLTRLAALPGVQSASAVNHIPLAGDVWGMPVAAEGAPIPSERDTRQDAPSATYRVSLPGYFHTMGISLNAGRDFAATDRRGAGDVVIVNQALAERLWPGESPLGKRLTLDDPTDHPAWRTVVGVVANVVRGEWTRPAGEELYVPFLQSEFLDRRSPAFATMTLVVRGSDGDPSSLAPAMRAAVASLDRAVPLSDVQSLAQIVTTATARPRFILLLLAVFAAAAGTLATVGLYGVTSYVVARRQREIGVRVALGAAPMRVARLIVVGAGIVAGALGSLALGRFMQHLLYGVSPTDVVTFGGVTIVLGAVALAAAYVPTRRAVRVDPLSALRAD